jgi:hypothetical protein
MPLNHLPGWERLDVAAPALGVDRRARVIRGVVVAQAGAFRTPGRGEFDAASLAAIVAQINAQPKGLKSRFTHPSLGGDGLGSFLGRAANARLDGDKVRADLHLAKSASKTPKGDLADYVMTLVEEDAGALGSSLVLQADKERRTDKGGRPMLSAGGAELPPLWRPTAIHAVDLVDEGEAVRDGLLSAQAAPAAGRGAYLRLRLAEALYSPDQPRDDQGQWAAEGGDSGAAGEFTRPAESNPKLPDFTRPKLTREEGEAVLDYAQSGYDRLNSAMREGGALAPEQQQLHERLHAAMLKTAEFSPAVTVIRGVGLGRAALGPFVEAAEEAARTGGSVTYKGYLSTTTNPELDADFANVRMSIQATRGLDVRGHAAALSDRGFRNENELLLPADTRLRIKSVRKVGDVYHVDAEQVSGPVAALAPAALHDRLRRLLAAAPGKPSGRRRDKFIDRDPRAFVFHAAGLSARPAEALYSPSQPRGRDGKWTDGPNDDGGGGFGTGASARVQGKRRRQDESERQSRLVMDLARQKAREVQDAATAKGRQEEDAYTAYQRRKSDARPGLFPGLDIDLTRGLRERRRTAQDAARAARRQLQDEARAAARAAEDDRVRVKREARDAAKAQRRAAEDRGERTKFFGLLSAAEGVAGEGA